MNLIFYIFNIFVQYLIIFFTLKIASFFPFSFIFGSYKTYLTFSSSIYSASFSVFPIASIFIFFKKILNFKITLVLSSIFFYILNSFKKLNLKILLSFLFLISYLILYNFNPEIYWYGFGWLISLFLVFSKNIFLKSFATVWFSHAMGTIFFILENPNFDKEFYQKIVLISWVERTILALGLLVFYFLFAWLKPKVNEFVFYLEKFLKKNLTIKEN